MHSRAAARSTRMTPSIRGRCSGPPVPGRSGPGGRPPGHPGQVGQGLFRYLDPHGPQALVLVRQRPAQEPEVRLRQGLEDEDRARDRSAPMISK